ncbi:Uncharacterised protein [Mycobacteroides abscessus]|nr:Uncharacterised protein [Mycobacteroides abscessus]
MTNLPRSVSERVGIGTGSRVLVALNPIRLGIPFW